STFLTGLCVAGFVRALVSGGFCAKAGVVVRQSARTTVPSAKTPTCIFIISTALVSRRCVVMTGAALEGLLDPASANLHKSTNVFTSRIHTCSDASSGLEAVYDGATTQNPPRAAGKDIGITSAAMARPPTPSAWLACFTDFEPVLLRIGPNPVNAHSAI